MAKLAKLFSPSYTSLSELYLAWSDIKAHDVTTFQPYSKERLIYIWRPKCDDVDFFFPRTIRGLLFRKTGG